MMNMILSKCTCVKEFSYNSVDLVVMNCIMRRECQCAYTNILSIK